MQTRVYGSRMNARQFSGIVELRTKIVSMSTFIISLLYVLWRQGQVSPLRAVLVCAAALAVDMGTTGFNSYFDWYRNVDDRRYNREDGKVLIHEDVSPGAALGVSLGCYAVAMALGRKLAPWIIYLQVAAGTVLLIVSGVSGWLPGAVAISSVPAGMFVFKLLRQMHLRGYSHETKGISMGGISKLFLVMSAGQALGLVAGMISIRHS
jgi:1,4-dihydroxy-2-naphthoate polyprenyltransferase